MIETRLPLVIQPGLFMNGTDKEGAGRWVNGDLVRFFEAQGIPRPVGDWVELTTASAPPSGIPRGAFAWYNTNGPFVRILVGTSASIYVIGYAEVGASTMTTITPAAGVVATSGTYSFTSLGDLAYFSRAGFIVSPLWKWSAATGGLAAPIANFTTEYGNNARGVVITPESFLLVIVGDRDVAWPKQDDDTVWAPTGTNQAGSLTIPTGGRLLRSLVVREETLLFSTTDLWRMDYVGGDLIYGFAPVAESCGLAGPNCAMAVNGAAYRMGENSFYQYDGFVRELPCDIGEYVFDDMNRANADFFFAIKNESYNEIWWFYASSGATTPDRVAIFNYANKTWSKGLLARAAGTDAQLSVFNVGQTEVRAPLLFHANDTIYLHELPTSPAGAFLESGPIKIADGAQLMRVQKVIPDGAHPDDTVTLFYKIDDGDAESSVSFTAEGGGEPEDVRFKGRYVRYKQLLNDPTSRVGVPELGVIASSRR
jgi:hypothetical protein